MTPRGFAAITAIGLALAAARLARPAGNEELRNQVRQAEIAFAKTMADRDHAAFQSHVADDALFLGRTTLRGRSAVAEGWKAFYDGKQAPFSWGPERVEVNDAGTLGISTGPVRDPSGKRVGTFNSIWRRESDGRWRVIFDNGCPPCDCPPGPPAPAAAPSPKG
jgi:ketosteroid isomerase-like protein